MSTITAPTTQHTDITIVLDASGSMDPIAVETVSAIQAFIDAQAAEPGTATLSIWIFSGHRDLKEIMHMSPLMVETVDAFGNCVMSPVKLDPSLYKPHGYTALNQATGTVMEKTGARYASETFKTDKRLFVIVTDGMENDSKGAYEGEEGRALIRSKIEHQKSKYQWEFVFLAANMDPVEVGATLGIVAASCLSFEATPEGVSRGIDDLSTYTRSYRSS